MSATSDKYKNEGARIIVRFGALEDSSSLTMELWKTTVIIKRLYILRRALS